MELTCEQRDTLRKATEHLESRVAKGLPDAEWVQKWREILSDGDLETFRERVERLPPEHDDTEGWIKTFEAVIEKYPDKPPDIEGHRAIDPEEPLPFEHILIPIVDTARTWIDAPDAGYTVTAYSNGERELLRRLVSVTARALYVEFQAYRTTANPSVLFTEPDLSSTATYEEFVEETFDGGLVKTCMTYPMLAYHLATVVKQWIRVTTQFRRRLEADRTRLAECFNDGEELGQIAALETGLSDPHGKGQTVFRLSFEKDVEIIYKPRSLETHVAFNRVLRWLSDSNCPVAQRALTVITGDQYGWVENAQPEPCTSMDAAERYYRRIGGLLSVLYVLNGTDCHFENLIAAGEYPVLIDTETLIHPLVPPAALPGDQVNRDHSSESARRDSVLWSGLLPNLVANGSNIDLSAVGATDIQETRTKKLTWNHVNTDAMDVDRQTATLKPSANIPRNNDQVYAPESFTESICRGFTETYNHLDERADTLLASGSPLTAFEDVSVRVVVRPTSTYQDVRERLLEPDALRSGAAHDIVTERLAATLTNATDDRLWPVIDAERTALRRLDIPRFTSRTTDTELRFDGKTIIEDAFEETSLDHVQSRIANLNQIDRDQQIAYIRASLGDDVTRVAHGDKAIDGDTTSVPNRETTPSEHELQTEIAAIADEICAAAINRNDGTQTWLTITMGDDVPTIHPLGYQLYDGRLGVALFFAAAGVVVDDKFTRLARMVADPIAEAVRDRSVEIAEKIGIGGVTGIGSLAYGLTVLGEMLGDAAYRDSVISAVEAITAERAAATSRHDLLSGTTGCVLSLSAVVETLDVSVARQRARVYADKFIASRSPDGDWPLRVDENPATGMAHGLSGAGLALARFAALTGSSSIRELTCEIVITENECQRPDENNWIDYRSGHPPRMIDAWCHGRSGIGLARLGAYTALRDESLASDVEWALEGIDGTAPATDQLCCGTAGRIAFLATAGRRLGIPQAEESAWRLTGQMIARAKQNGGYRYHASGYLVNPTLFQGLAGIGYQLCRLIAPDQIPAVTMLESEPEFSNR